MLPASLRQATASILLMSGIYLSNVLFNVPDSTKSVNDSKTIDDGSFSMFQYPMSVLRSTSSDKLTLGTCRLLADNSFSKMIEPYYNDRVFYSDSLGRHCRVKLNITIDHGVVTIYETFTFKIDNVYKSLVLNDDTNDVELEFDEYDINNDYVDSTDPPYYVKFINKTGIELSFNAHPYDDTIHTDDAAGIILYAIRNLETLYIIIISERLKVYVLESATERELSRNYESYIFKVLKYEPECSKYIHCTNHVKSVKK